MGNKLEMSNNQIIIPKTPTTHTSPLLVQEGLTNLNAPSAKKMTGKDKPKNEPRKITKDTLNFGKW